MSRTEAFRFGVETCQVELPRVGDDIRWAHANGYWPASRWIDDVGGVDLSRPEEERDRAPQLDIGLGDFASREALAGAPAALGRVEVHLAAALVMTGRRRQPSLVKPAETGTPGRLLVCVTTSCWRAAELAKVADPTHDAVRHTGRAAAEVTQLRKSFIDALHRGPELSSVPAGQLCRICKLRPRADKAGGRCNICATWFHRHNHQERPCSLDNDIRLEPRLRQVARQQRGEGWGMA